MPLLDDVIEARVNAGAAAVSRTYTDPEVSLAGFPAGVLEKCGARLHYLADYVPDDPATGSVNEEAFLNMNLFHASYSLRNSLYFRKIDNTDP